MRSLVFYSWTESVFYTLLPFITLNLGKEKGKGASNKFKASGWNSHEEKDNLFLRKIKQTNWCEHFCGRVKRRNKKEWERYNIQVITLLYVTASYGFYARSLSHRVPWKQKQGKEHVLDAEVLGYPGQTWFSVAVVPKGNHSCLCAVQPRIHPFSLLQLDSFKVRTDRYLLTRKEAVLLNCLSFATLVSQ